MKPIHEMQALMAYKVKQRDLIHKEIEELNAQLDDVWNEIWDLDSEMRIEAMNVEANG